MSLQLEAESKEEARLRHKREMIQKANARITNPLNPVFDPAALDAQIQEKRQKQIMAREAGKLERQRIDEVERILEEAALEEKKMKQIMAQQLREDYLKTRSEVSSGGRKIRSIDPVVPENCGASACQAFIGEDPNCKDRQRLQKAQMRRWVEQQVAEKEERKRKEKEEEYRYFQYIKMLDDCMGSDSGEKAELERRKQLELAQKNKEMADELARKKAEERDKELHMNEDEISATMSLDIMLEDASSVVADNGKIARPDHFKGFTTEQRQKIYKDNQTQLAKQRAAERMEKERMAQIEAQAMQVARQQEKALAVASMRKEMERKQFMADQLKVQADEQASKKAASKADRFGSIEGESSMFSKFNGQN